MTLLKWQNDNKLAPNYNSFFNDWFHDSYFDKVAVGTSIPAVNIKDNEHKEYRSILPKNFIMQK